MGGDPRALALWAFCLALGVLPVLAFLASLVVLDSYKLIRLRRVLLLVAAGGAVAWICRYLNPWLIDRLAIDPALYTRAAGPFVEEVLKGSIIAVGLYKRRIGFLVDAAIWGFAIGAGFAAFENTHYFVVLAKPSPMLWIVRGFGTAIMHGGATSLMAVLSKQLSDRFDTVLPPVILPGMLLATVVHSAFNRFYVSPTLSTLLLLVILPLLFVLVFRLSESATHRWLGVGFDSDQELLEIINSGRVSEMRVGRYLNDLKQRLPGETVVDMLCLIRLHLELSIRAKGVLMMRKAGFDAPADPEVGERLRELAHLEKSVGPTGMIALHPIFNMSHHDLWQLHRLREEQS
jgi:RsiW-degrading membrane proteinase PrsW (M82 family)